MTGRLLVAAAALVAVGVATVGLTTVVVRPSPPGAGSVDVGFAQDMSVHHAQAVEMAGLVLERTDGEAVTTLATDIMLTQQGQIGQMHGWLELWDQPKTTVGPRMAWMTPNGAGMAGRMRGMATPDQIESLRRAQGVQAERLFLELMIEHHRAGVDMAKVATVSAAVPDVRRLARTMVTGQQVEIEAMTTMLDDRGGAPAGPRATL